MHFSSFPDCSLCIRKYMQYKSVCPTCFEETYEVALRNNRSLDEVISLFTGIRDKVIRHLKLAAIHVPLENDPDITINSASKVNSKKDDNSLSKMSKLNGDHSLTKGKFMRRLDNDIVNGDSESGLNVLTSPTTPLVSESSISNEYTTTPVRKIPSMFYSPKKLTPNFSPASSTSVPTVACPVCSVEIPDRNINIHLDKCLARVGSPLKK